MIKTLELIGREKELFTDDISDYEATLKDEIKSSTFLVIGAAGSIGSAVVKEIFKRNPRKLHVVDISENNLVELVRDIRSSFGYIGGEFATFAIDAGSKEYDAFIGADGKYDYVLNLSALKHVRSEKDPFTLMRMIEVNILNTIKTMKQTAKNGGKKYFCVSTDKAANPVNMMGASKRIMELFATREADDVLLSMARFANVAFSDGSLLHGFNERIKKLQPIVAPNDIKRYFVTPKESGELCLMSAIFGQNCDIFFPKLSQNLHLITFADIAVRYLENLGYEPFICADENEARARAKELAGLKKWACLFTPSDTTGEKDFEEFYTDSEILDMDKFKSIGVIKNSLNFDSQKLDEFLQNIQKLKNSLKWSKDDILAEFLKILPNFNHKETGKYLDSKM
ncbi:UDP-N-acetylglucosamine 4,6-dehydratase [Campylobacter mucosalis]|uniref:UDP-N-acetylglucosamine 4,6-dehydratase n=1 Tax=Campylobacter mucosalis TaxID=202 RepID=UPI0004D374CE|nr:UDP-N-acetylglucosamine 4,6-dehydratase [Campylobacter mucosalis]KEA45842.1 UDP-N-acetylglucosamine 4,6-dehydratase [Campylobacter mucosalis]QKF62372.1 UDP-GlcNac (UDP-linked N-acetylglucosamine) inverting 4,6-dehydratase [Campylobacter mucosalis]